VQLLLEPGFGQQLGQVLGHADVAGGLVEQQQLDVLGVAFAAR